MPSFSGTTDSAPIASFRSVDDAVDLIVDEISPPITNKFDKQGIIVRGTAQLPGFTAPVALEGEMRSATADERVAVWVNLSGPMATAVGDALRAANLPAHTDSITEGGRLRIRHTGTAPSGKGNPTKLYSAKYDAPAVSAGGGGEWD